MIGVSGAREGEGETMDPFVIVWSVLQEDFSSTVFVSLSLDRFSSYRSAFLTAMRPFAATLGFFFYHEVVLLFKQSINQWFSTDGAAFFSLIMKSQHTLIT